MDARGDRMIEVVLLALALFFFLAAENKLRVRRVRADLTRASLEYLRGLRDEQVSS